jgi:hypothetical protein
MLRLLFKLSLFSPLVAVMVWVNWTVDPARFFVPRTSVLSAGYEGVIVEDLFAGRPHEVSAEYDQRVVFEELLRKQQSLDVLVLGSSVAKPFHSELFPEGSFLNGAIHGGELEEAVCSYELAWECGFRPKRVLLQFQGWGRMLGLRTNSVERNTEAVLGRAVKRMGTPLHSDDPLDLIGNRLLPVERAAEFKLEQDWRWLHPYDKLISPRYFQMSVGVLMRTGWPKTVHGARVVPMDVPEIQRNLLYPDFSIQWSQFMRSATPESIRRFHAAVFPGVTKLEQTRPIESRCRLFETFVTDMLNSGTKVDLVLSPPISWLAQQVDSQYAGSDKLSPSAETERYLRTFAESHQIKVFGTFDPRKTDLTDADFVDYLHIRRESIGRLLSEGNRPKFASGTVPAPL